MALSQKTHVITFVIAQRNKEFLLKKSRHMKDKFIKSHIAYSIHRSVNKMFDCKIVIIFLPISFNIYFGCSKEPSH